MSVSSFELANDLESRMIEQRDSLIERVDYLINGELPQDALVTHELTGSVVYLPQKIIGDKKIGISFQGETEARNFILTIYIDDEVERSFHSYKFMKPMIITDEESCKISESHAVYLAASETLRYYVAS